MTVAPEFVAEASAIDDARVAAYAALRAASRRGLTGADVDAFHDAMEEITARCEVLRRRFYPRRHRLIVACGVAMVVSRTYRSREVVWTRPDRRRR
ncbi:hypothetical protein [Nocardia terpenica]|uniref:Uncharacterized protein n=1 Tax=Nocardia terpenica TaxID=455432 RepID=A0A6G9Z284_9NOCA|nr:hypothetical protein [Nocardia terpenica]QIS19564.1 hypothetical protein F6W96_16005 [Nocardia terpenica]